jgi:hypothetical protein
MSENKLERWQLNLIAAGAIGLPRRNGKSRLVADMFQGDESSGVTTSVDDHGVEWLVCCSWLA